jgi:predicted TIM-barrel fold metal-dependent hydrolase
VVCVFARKTSEPLASLAKKIDEKIRENDRLKSFVVVLTDKGDEAADELRKLAQDARIKHVPLTLHQNPSGPPDYELAENADVTVLMWKEGKVRVNHAYRGELTNKEISAVVADIPKVLSD